MVENGGDLTAKIAVQQIDEVLRRQAFRLRGESAHVGEPDRGADRLDITAADVARENALAGLMADIGVDQIAGGAAQRANFGDARERRDHRLQIGELLRREAARLPRRPCHDMDRTVGEGERERRIIGRAVGTQIAQHVEVDRTRRVGQTAAQDLSGGIDRGEGALAKIVRLGQRKQGIRRRHSGLGLPQEPTAQNVRMQRGDEHRDAPQRHAAANHPLAQFRQHVIGVGAGAGAIREPLDHGPDIGHRQALEALLRMARSLGAIAWGDHNPPGDGAASAVHHAASPARGSASRCHETLISQNDAAE